MHDLGQSDVFIDLGVQRDYLAADGVQRCTNADAVNPTIRHLMAFARWSKVPLLSCIDVHRANEISEGILPLLHRGRCQQQRPSYGVMPNHALVESDNCLCVSLEVLQHHQQAVFTKYHRDPFTNPKLDRLLTEMPARRFIVLGVSLETSLRILVLGLLRRMRRVALIEDACGYWNREEARMVVRQLAVKGCEIFRAQTYIESALAGSRTTYRTRRDGRTSAA